MVKENRILRRICVTCLVAMFASLAWYTWDGWQARKTYDLLKASAQQTAQAAQALHAGTIRQQLTDGEDDPNQQGQTVEQKKSWFSKVFGGR